MANRHRVDPSSLQRRLRGDLDWITLKAMEKDRTRRYGTAEALADSDNTMALTPKESPEYVDLSTQRCEMLLRMASYERTIAEAPDWCMKYVFDTLEASKSWHPADREAVGPSVWLAAAGLRGATIPRVSIITRVSTRRSVRSRSRAQTPSPNGSWRVRTSSQPSRRLRNTLPTWRTPP